MIKTLKNCIQNINFNIKTKIRRHEELNLWNSVGIDKKKNELVRNCKENLTSIKNTQTYDPCLSFLNNINISKEINQLNSALEVEIKNTIIMQKALKKIADLEIEIAKKSKTRENHLKKNQSIITTTARQMADLLAISEDNANYINTLLKRARNKLKEFRKNRDD